MFRRSFLAKWNSKINRDTSRKRYKGHKDSLYQALEPKNLLAANIFYDASTDIVSVYGDNAGDRVDITAPSANQVTVSVDGGDSQTFDLADVQLVRYYANGGNDSLYNSTSVDTLFAGGAGDDFLSGGSGVDTSYAGSGTDTLHGGDGNDVLHGDDGNDVIYGDGGDDTLHGSNDNDTIYGGLGDDSIYGGWGNDTLYGNEGADRILAFNGNDIVEGNEGNDAVYGQGGDDFVYGNAGDDRVRGNNGNDTLYGGDGSDFMMSDNGDDYAYGEAGADRIYAHYGTDFLFGGDGDDLIVGEFDTNELHGEGGEDTILGGSGVDLIFGGDGDDLLYGRDGNDELDGQLGADRLLGGNGDDALWGGEAGAVDELVGGFGNDRFLKQLSDVVEDEEAGDAVLEFLDRTAAWADAEIVVLKDAFRQLYDAVGNNLLLQETLNDDSLRFYKYADLNGAAGINYLETSTRWYFVNGERITEHSYYREIRIVDWNENSTFYNNQFVDVTIHEIAHNWDSETELSSVSGTLGGHWDTFLGLSSWTQTNPNSGGFTQSHDGQWWYANSSEFAENYGRTNPYEDMATMFELYFNDGPGTGTSNLDQKLDLVDSIFSVLSTLD